MIFLTFFWIVFIVGASLGIFLILYLWGELLTMTKYERRYCGLMSTEKFYHEYSKYRVIIRIQPWQKKFSWLPRTLPNTFPGQFPGIWKSLNQIQFVWLGSYYEREIHTGNDTIFVDLHRVKNIFEVLAVKQIFPE